MTTQRKDYLEDVPKYVPEKIALERERFNRLMIQHQTQRVEERRQALLLFVSITLTCLAIKEVIHSIRKWCR